MRRTLGLFLVIFSIGVCLADSDVLTLTADNFDSTLAENPLVLVEFYAPWCGHCKKLAPEYEKAATLLKEKEIAGKLASVDADDQKNADLRNRFDIRGFPTIKLFRNGVPTEYQGGRTAEEIFSYVKKQAQPASTPLTAADAASKFADEERVVIVGFFDDKESTVYKTWEEVTKNLRDSFTFGEVVGNADVNKALGVEKTPSIVLFKKFDEKKNVLDAGDFAEQTIVEFLQKNSIPLIDEIGPHNFKAYVDSGLPLAYLFVDLSVEGQRDQFVEEVNEIAKETRGKINWVVIDWSKYAKHSERLGLSGKTVPALAIEKLEEGTHFVFDEAATIAKDAVNTWVRSFVDGKVEPTIKSEPVPEDNNGPVKTVVANNFNEIVNDPTKDVFLEFYAPWCGHCKKLAPVYDELGAALKESNPNVVIAKIDATANDISPKLNVRGFPTIKLFLANNKDEPIEYNGDRSLADMTTFIQQNTGAAAPASTEEATEKKDEL